jgi:hypothetical protein
LDDERIYVLTVTYKPSGAPVVAAASLNEQELIEKAIIFVTALYGYETERQESLGIGWLHPSDVQSAGPRRYAATVFPVYGELWDSALQGVIDRKDFTGQ